MEKEYLKNSLKRMCVQPRSFEYISNNIGGLDPIKTVTLLQELTDEGELVDKDGYWSISTVPVNDLFQGSLDEGSVPYLKKFMGHFDFLKNPHPLDFEWRNTAKSLNYLAGLIGKVNGNTDKVLILGMPTLFATCSARNLTQNITLIERNSPIIQGLNQFRQQTKQIIEDDIFHAKPDNIGKYHSVFIDPPWYTNYLYQFVWLAAKCLQPNGVLVISIPPINTRDEVDQERVEWFSFCQQQGLCIERLDPEVLQYAMPFFEFNAFRAAGVSNTLPFWRKGDLVYFRKVRESDSLRPELTIPTEPWEEFEVDSVRVRVMTDHDGDGKSDMQIDSIVPQDILPSVSRSNELRKSANIWTSGNRVFRTNRPRQFYEALKSGKNDLVNQWRDMVMELENKEYRNYLGHIYYEMERQSN